MKKYHLIFLYVIFILILSSCKPGLSNLEQITSQVQTCEVNKEKAEYYYEKYGKNNSKITLDNSPINNESKISMVKQAFERLSNVPEEYLNFVFVTHNAAINLSNNDTNGLTVSHETKDEFWPVRISYAGLTVLPHEFGHASEGYIWTQVPDFNSKLTELSDTVLKNYSSITRQYLTSQTDLNTGAQRTQRQQNKETFAELFDTWYCSAAARNNLKEKMPEVYNFAQQYLISPETSKDINLYLVGNNSNLKIYFANNKSTSTISYCMYNQSGSCSNKIELRSFKNNTNKDNMYESENINVSNISSFTLEVYEGSSLLRKTLISK